MPHTNDDKSDADSSCWSVTDNDDNSQSIATKAAVAGKDHFITGIQASYSATKSGKLCVLKDGTTEIARWYVYDHLEITFDQPIRLTTNTAANLEVAASGTGSNISAASMQGYTTQDY